MTVSVVVATRNSGKTFEKCISSLNGFDRIVVVDNCSKDGTREIARRYGALVIMERDAGFFGAYNLGFQKTDSEFVMFLDSDAFLLDFDFNAALKPFQDPKVGMVVCLAHAPIASRRGIWNWPKLMDDLWWWRNTQIRKYARGEWTSWLDRQYARFFMSKNIGSGATTTGPCYILRKSAIAAMGGMNKRADDFVLKKLLRDKGYEVRFYVSESVFHITRQKLGKLGREFLQFGLRGSHTAGNFYTMRERLTGFMMMVLSIATAPHIAKNSIDPRHLLFIPTIRSIQAIGFLIGILVNRDTKERMNYATY